MRRLSELAGRGPASLTALLAPCLVLILALMCTITQAADTEAIFEDFGSSDNWEDFYFKDIDEHSTYYSGEKDGLTVLIANSSASASAFMLQRDVHVYNTPHLSWRWRVEDIYKKADLKQKSGDDSPMRIYIMFEYDPERATSWMKFKYGLLKLIYGQYPPHASINYIWASRTPRGSLLDNAYTDRVRMFVVRSGRKDLGQWHTEEADIIEDYRRAFGEDPPERARIAVMNDSDNTGESSISYMDYIKVSAKPHQPEQQQAQ